MVMRLTERLAAKIHVTATASLPLDADPLADWSARLFTVQRTQYLLFTNTATLYSVLLPGRGVTGWQVFLDRAVAALVLIMLADGLDSGLVRLQGAWASPVAFSKSLSRSFTASVNQLVYNASYDLEDGWWTLLEVSRRANEVPLSCLGMTSPERAWRELMEP